MHDHHHEFDDYDDGLDGDIEEGGVALIKPPRDPGRPPKWYRPKLTREELSSLNAKSDLKAFAQTLGFLSVLVVTGALFVLACFRAPYLAPIALLVHGACCTFLVNGFHELVHESVFKTRRLNGLFLRVFSFLGWYNHVQFWASHTEHHKFTLHPPDDREVVLPQQATLKSFLRSALFDYKGLYCTLKGTINHAAGRLSGGWERHLFEDVNPQLQTQLRQWAWLLLIGHGSICIAAIATGYWPIAIAISFGKFFGNGLNFLCNATQHIGLVDHYPDFRVCCRTIYLHPVLQFLYWHMNYHTEHHMYAGVPCYNLGRLHRLIQHEMPTCPNGLFQTWRQISMILKRQRNDPTYQYVAIIPDRIVSVKSGSV